LKKGKALKRKEDRFTLTKAKKREDNAHSKKNTRLGGRKEDKKEGEPGERASLMAQKNRQSSTKGYQGTCASKEKKT